MIHRSFGKTDVGQARKTNEDSLEIVGLDDGEPALFVVADGVGGRRSGEVASQLTVESIKQDFLRQRSRFAAYSPERDEELRDSLTQMVSKLIEDANSAVYERSQTEPEYQGMCTTAVVLVVAGEGAFLAHAGDKHKALDPKDAEGHPYANVLARSVGTAPHVEVDTAHFHVQPGDRFVLCSDGVTTYLRGAEIQDVSTSAESPEALVTKLVKESNGRGGEDNITAIAIEIEGEVQTPRTIALQEEIKLLQGMFLFDGLSAQEVLRLMRITYRVRRSAGQEIIHEGAEGRELFIILEGAVDVSLRKAHLNTIEAGGHFGELALIDNEVRAATVTAKTDVNLLSIRHDDFAALIHMDRQLANKLMWSFLKVVAGNVRTLSKAFVSLASLSNADSEATIVDFSPEKFSEI